MYIDKKRAIRNEWRIKEATLMSIAVIGGSIGSMIGMYSLDIKLNTLNLHLVYHLYYFYNFY